MRDNIISIIQERINNNEFKDKNELISFLNDLKKQGLSESIITNEKITELLNLFDQTHSKEKSSLDLENYSSFKLENQNVIVSKKDDIVLKTNRPSEELPQEFKENQNELTAMSNDGLANADMTFDYMEKYKKEKMNLISLSEAVEKDNINKETLNKIKFFINNSYTNPSSYKVDIERDIFYNIENQEVLEVRKNQQTGKYEIYKGGELAYSNNSSDETKEDNFEKETDTNEEKMPYLNKNENVKIRRLIKPKDMNNNAFIKGSLLIIISLITSFLLSLLIISQK